MYAIIEDSGTQIRVQPDEVVEIDLRPIEGKSKKKTLSFDKVLLIGDADKKKAATVGTPYISGASVTAEVLEEVKDKKLDVIMYKRRKGQKRKLGHRQRYLKIKITEIKS